MVQTRISSAYQYNPDVKGRRKHNLFLKNFCKPVSFGTLFDSGGLAKYIREDWVKRRCGLYLVSWQFALGIGYEAGTAGD